MAPFTWLVMRNALFSFLNILKDVVCVNVRKFVKLSIMSIIFWTYIYKIRNVGIPMGINCAPLTAYLILFCYQ